jgi:methylamine utilization protein MauJ/SEC-C motif-containing protein
VREFCEGKGSNCQLMTKIGRNEPCPCDSGKKYKECCGGPADVTVPQPIYAAKHPISGPIKIDVPGLPGHRQSLIMQNYFSDLTDSRHSADINGEPGEYRVVFTLHRPEIPIRPEGDYATAEHMQGDSHLSIAKPAHPHPDLPKGTHVRLFSEIDNEKFMFICYPNDEGFLGKIELGSINADNYDDAAGRAFRGVTFALSGMSFRYDVPLDIYQIDVIEQRTQSVRFSMITPFRETPFLGTPTLAPTQDFLKYASYYREGLVSNSLNYQFLCFYKIIEGVRKRRQRLIKTAIEAAKKRAVRLPSRNEERIPEEHEEQIKWLNSVFSTRQLWDDLAVKAIFPAEAVGKKISHLISEEGQLDTVRNKIAHAILRSEEPTLSIDEASSVEMVNKWLQLTKCIARHLLNKEFPDRSPDAPPKQRIVKWYRSRKFIPRAAEDHIEYDPVPGSLEFIKDMASELHLGKVKLPGNTINIEEEGIAIDADGHPTVIYVGMEVDDEGLERILFIGHVNMSVSPPTWNVYGTRPRLG